MRTAYPPSMWKQLIQSISLFFRGLVNDEKNPKIWFCSGILVTITRVLTADHCLWLEKPRNWAFNEPGEKDKFNEVNFK